MEFFLDVLELFRIRVKLMNCQVISIHHTAPVRRDLQISCFLVDDENDLLLGLFTLKADKFECGVRNLAPVYNFHFDKPVFLFTDLLNFIVSRSFNGLRKINFSNEV